MTRRGTRTIQSEQRREAKQIILLNAKKDKIIGEIINNLTVTEIENKLAKIYGFYYVGVVDKIVKGECLITQRGDGTYQKVTEKPEQEIKKGWNRF